MIVVLFAELKDDSVFNDVITDTEPVKQYTLSDVLLHGCVDVSL